MANNRMYIVFKPTGDKVYLGKRMGWGWYDVPKNLPEKLEQLFQVAETCLEDNFHQDDFAIGMEDPLNDSMVNVN